MNCNDFEQWLDDYLDRDLGPEQMAVMATHQQACDSCRRRIDEEQKLRTALRRIPAPEPSAAFIEQALQRVTRRQRMRRSKRIGFALAAGLVLSLSITALFDIGNQPAIMSGQKPVVQIALNEKRNVKLVFNSATELDAAQVTLRLPEQVRVAGYPDRQISWAARLKQGKNLLVLPVSAQHFGHGTLVAEIEHDGVKKSFTVDLDVIDQPQSIRSHPGSRTV